MKWRFVKITSLLVFLCFAFMRCDDEIPETEPSVIILGKWELQDDSGSTEILEFMQDSIINRTFYYEENLKTESAKFWVDSLLNYDFMLGPWFYEFSDNNNKMELENAFPALTGIHNTYLRVR